jgi:transposase
MKRFIEGQDRSQVTLLPECLDDYIGEDNPVRAVDAFIDELDLDALGFEGATAAATGRPSHHPRSCSKSMSTATSIGSSRAAGSSAKPSATLN